MTPRGSGIVNTFNQGFGSSRESSTYSIGSFGFLKRTASPDPGTRHQLDARQRVEDVHDLIRLVVGIPVADNEQRGRLYVSDPHFDYDEPNSFRSLMAHEEFIPGIGLRHRSHAIGTAPYSARRATTGSIFVARLAGR